MHDIFAGSFEITDPAPGSFPHVLFTVHNVNVGYQNASEAVFLQVFSRKNESYLDFRDFLFLFELCVNSPKSVSVRSVGRVGRTGQMLFDIRNPQCEQCVSVNSS